MANTNFKVDNGLLVNGDSTFTANVEVTQHMRVRQTLGVNGDVTISGNLTYANTSISGELIPTANGVLLGNSTRTFTVSADNLSFSNSIVTANGTNINIRAGDGIIANATGLIVNASSISNGILNIGQGGTNGATRAAGLNNLLPTQNTAVNNFYLKTDGTNASWVSGIGFTGSQGIQGFIGFTGSQGTQGSIGFTGSAGTNGTNGSIGFTGSKGDTGFTGSKGDIGFTGSAGPAGGSNTQVQFNDSGVANGATGFTFNKTTSAFAVPATLTAGNSAITGTVNITATDNITAALGIGRTSTGVYVLPNAGVGAYNNLVLAGDNIIYFSNNTVNNGNLVIGTWTNRAAGYGIRFTGASYDLAITANTVTVTGNTTITGFANVSTTLQVGTNTSTFGTAAYILANGTFGIATSSPQSKMEIRATSGGSVFNALTLSNYVNASVGTGVALYFDPNGAGSLGRAASIQSVQATSGNYADLRFFTANADVPAERMQIAANGNVGIGTSSPSFPLDIQGSANTAAGYIRTYNSNTGSLATTGVQFQTTTVTGIYSVSQTASIIGTTTAHPLAIYANNTTVGYFAANGNFGVGWSTPAYKVQAAGVIASQVSGESGFRLYNNGAVAEWFIGQRSNTSHSLTFSKVVSGAYTDYLAISSDGYLTNPTFRTYKEFVNAVTISTTTQTLDLSTTNIFNLTLANSATLTFSNPPASGTAYTLTLYCKQDATGSRTLTWPASVKWPNASAPTMSTGANKIDIFSFFTLDGGTTYVGALALANVG